MVTKGGTTKVGKYINGFPTDFHPTMATENLG
jgi:hypothetical protein